MMKANLNLTIQDGCHHFYTEFGEKLDYCCGSTIIQDDEDLWFNAKAKFEAEFFVYPELISGGPLWPLRLSDDNKRLVTKNGDKINAEIVMIKKNEDGDVSSVKIRGYCFLPFSTNHKQAQ